MLNSSSSLQRLVFLSFCIIPLKSLYEKLYAMDPVTYGAETKVHASMGIITSSYAIATFYNPALISLNDEKNKYEIYYDQNIAYVRLVYEHPLYQPLVYNLIVPPFSAGSTFKLNDNLNIAVAFAPVGSGGTSKIKKLPLDIMSNSTDTFDINISRLAAQLGVSVKYSFNNKLDLGLSLIDIYEKEKLQVYEINGSKDPLVDSYLSGNFLKPIFGMVYSSVDYNLQFGFIYFPPIKKRYRNAVTVIAGGQPVKVEAAQYIAQTFGVGVHKRFIQKGGLVLEYSTELYSKGRTIVKRGFGFDPPETDLKDTHNFSLSGYKIFSNNKKLILGVGYYPEYVGKGRYADENNSDNQGVMGVRFGDFQAIGYIRVGAGYEFSYKKCKSCLLSFGYTHGTRMVPRRHPGQGRYKMQFTFLGIRSIF